MQRFLLLVAVLPVVALSKSTINERSLFANTIKKWNVQVRDRRDLRERWNRLLQAKRNVDDTTSGVMLESLNRFAVNNEEEHAALTDRAKRSANLTLTSMNAMELEEEAEQKRLVKRETNHDSHNWKEGEMPLKFDYWEKEIGLTEPKDQMSCGSCWSFPTTGALEALYKKLTGDTVSFAEQYFVDCAFGYSGCSGGVANDGYKFIKRTEYLPLEGDYPYTANYNPAVGCPEFVTKKTKKNGMEKMLLQDWYPLSHDETSFLTGLKYSPVAFGSYVGDRIFDYSGGVFEDSSCIDNPSPHAQLLVGYTEEYIRVKGSYGVKWGDKGFANYKRSPTLETCNYYKNAFFILATQRREEKYVFCKDGKLGTRDECQKSCQSMNKDGETGWELAVIPTEMHNQQVIQLVEDTYPGPKADEKFRLLWIGLNDPKKHDHYHWSDYCTPANYVTFSKPFGVGKYGLFDKNTGKWKMKNSPTFRARGLCSRAETCWDITNAVRHGTVTITGNLAEGTSAVIVCDEGYTLVGEDTLQCAGGVWNGNADLPICDHPHDHDHEDHEDHDHDGDGEQDHTAEDHEDHDHDGDGEQDHAAEDHEDHDHDGDGKQDHAADDHGNEPQKNNGNKWKKNGNKWKPKNGKKWKKKGGK